VIEASQAARRAIENALAGQPDMTVDPKILARKKYLKQQAEVTLQAIRKIADKGVLDPLIDAEILAKAVSLGIMDAPQLKNNAFAPGKICTRVVNGCCEAVSETGEPITEEERLEEFLN
jgi:hypothetical protein